MAAGSLAAHSLSYLFVSARVSESGAEVSERASSAGAGYMVLFVGIFAATTVLAGGVAGLLLGRRRSVLSPWLFFILPPLAFALQEFSERLLHSEVFPFHAALEPRLLLGLLLQFPFGLLALLLARVLLRVAERLLDALARPKTSRLVAIASWWARQALDLPRIPALALGYPQRGPPSL
jgi:hypothetical protein